MKRRILSTLLLIVSLSSCVLVAMIQPGPMNSEWFYAKNHPFVLANNLHQECRWEEAEAAYKKRLIENVGTEYDKKMATVNLAACEWAQGKPTKNWGAFDELIGIDDQQLLSEDKINYADKKKSVLIRTDQVGIGDIVHFIETANGLKKKRPEWNVIVSVPPVLRGTASNVVKQYGCEIISNKDEQPKTDYTTHIIGLLGHLNMNPAATKPEILLAVSEEAMRSVYQQVDPYLRQGKTLAVIIAGEDRQATLIGGKLLPRNKTDHGRQLSPAVFQRLLEKNRDLVLVDCGTKASRITVTEDLRDRVIIPQENQPFDVHIALAKMMGLNDKIVAILTDQGPANVFARAASEKAQEHIAIIIPNPEEADMRMQSKNREAMYKQMISNCFVFKSKSPQLEDQVAVVENALRKITTGK
jgi:hypothetical protein